MICGKCEEREAAEGQRWCAPCFAVYKREYRKRVQAKRERAAFFRGAEAFRALAMMTLRVNFGLREITGLRAANELELLAVRPASERGLNAGESRVASPVKQGA